MNRYTKVRELVKDPSLTIKNIAQQTGYDKGHVSRLRKEFLRQAPKEKQEPVAWMMVNKVIGPPSLHWKPQEDWHITWECKPLYTAPPKREWVGLTEEDMEALFLNEDGVRFARYIEAKLREKNNG